MIFNLSIGELLIISLFFVTSINCALTYFCCVKSLNILEENKSVSKAVNKLSLLDQYVLSKINFLVALLYFGLSYLFFDSLIEETSYLFLFSCLLSFCLTLITTFLSRLCYCYTCNLLLETKLNEVECFILNFKRLVMIYMPFVVVSLIIPTIYLLSFDEFAKNIISIIVLILILILWVILTPRIMIFNYNAKRIENNSLLKYRLERLMDLHEIKKYKLYYWDTSRSKESNAMASGIRTFYLFVSSSLIDEVTLPELETVITHEIGHIKSKHIIKMMIGKIFALSLIVFLAFGINFFNISAFSRILLYLLVFLLACLFVLIGIGIERKYEIQADLYASMYNDSDLFASALKKITKYEDEENCEGNILESHPNVKERIEKVKKENK